MPRLRPDESVTTHPGPKPTVDASRADCYLPLRALSAYAGICVRTLRTRLRDVADPLPHYRVGGKILVKRSEFDAWMRSHRQRPTERVNELVASVLRSL